ncbi:hypothetical protein ACFV9D_03710 [Streptomyces sp. NPDC059875]|uniref:hypothetical protein n=1 Tax=unclassified Streptomyces TaxID=2593676 RepID=UPI00366896E6
MLKRRASAAWRRRTVTAAVSAVVSAVTVGVVGASPATAGQTVTVDCGGNPAALRTAVAGAASGDTLRVRGTCTGPFVIDRNLTLTGLGNAVLDGNFAGSTVVVNGTAQVRLDSLTVINGTGTVVNGQVFGGGILNNGGGSTVTVANSTVRNNAAQFGGGIAHLAVGGGSVRVERSTVRDNTAGASGGAVFIGRESTLTVSSSVLRDNNAAFGGAILTDANGRVTLSSTTVRDNSATQSGGGISTLSGSTLTLIRSRVEGNSAGGGPGSGGGIVNAGGTVTLTRSDVVNNRPDNCAPPGSVAGCIG